MSQSPTQETNTPESGYLDAWQDLATRIENLVRHRRQVLRLGRRESDLTNEFQDPIRVQGSHVFGRSALSEQRRGDLVDLLVRRLGRQSDRDRQCVRVGVVERDRNLGIELVEDLADLVGFVGSLHLKQAPG